MTGTIQFTYWPNDNSNIFIVIAPTSTPFRMSEFQNNGITFRLSKNADGTHLSGTANQILNVFLDKISSK
jgi:hypothetical protein